MGMWPFIRRDRSRFLLEDQGASHPRLRSRLQANDLLSLKPTLAKKLSDKIKSLQAEIEVLRSDTKVNELERKIQVLAGDGLSWKIAVHGYVMGPK